MKKVLLFTIALLSSLFIAAQDTNEFQRIARRIMDAYDVGDEIEHAPDSSHFYGGAYLGAGSNGRAMPSGYATYLKDNLLWTSQLAYDTCACVIIISIALGHLHLNGIAAVQTEHRIAEGVVSGMTDAVIARQGNLDLIASYAR